MGNDGGTIAKRQDIISLYKSQEKPTVKMEDELDLSKCRLSQELLIDEKVVADYMGNLMLKEKVIEFILNKGYKTNETFNHIKLLLDVFDVHPVFKDGHLQCPVTLMNEKFVAFTSCGCILDRKTVEKLGGNVCPKCNKPGELVNINVGLEEMKEMRHKLKARKLKSHKVEKPGKSKSKGNSKGAASKRGHSKGQ